MASNTLIEARVKALVAAVLAEEAAEGWDGRR